MASSMAVLLRRGPVCRSCLVRYARVAAPTPRRSISTGHIRKTAEAEEAWQIRAQEILDGKQVNTWDIFEERGYVKDTAG